MRSKVTTVLDLAGVAAVTAGVALWSVPAALVTFGLALLLISWRAAR